MATSTPEAVFRRWVDEVWNGRRLEGAAALVAPEVAFATNVALDGPAGGGSLHPLCLLFLAPVGDLRFAIEEVTTDGDTVICHWTARRTCPLAGFLALPRGGAAMAGASICRVANGKIVEHRARVDQAALLCQLVWRQPPSTVRP